MTRWTRRLAPSASLDQNVRTALWALSLIAVLGTAVAVLSAGLPPPLLALALAGLGFLTVHWGRSRRVTRVRWTGDVLDALAVVAVIAAVPGSNQVLALPTSAILLRSIRPGLRAAVLRLVLHCAAIGAGTLAAGVVAGDPQVVAAVTAVVQTAAGLVFATAFVQLLSSALVRTDRSLERNTVLTTSGMRLMTASTAQEVVAEAREAAEALVASARGVQVRLVDQPEHRVERGRGLWDAPGRGAQRPPDRVVVFGARAGDGRLELSGPTRAVEEVVPALTALGQYVGLSLQKCRALEELRQRAETDGLTGLVSAETFRATLRALVDDVAGHEVVDEDRHGTLLVVDCDDFKAVNDTFGHLAGDAVLLEIAQRLRADSRAGDVVARLGGDEFAVLLASTLDQDTHVRVERLTRVLAQPVDTGGHRVEISCSVGSARVVPGHSLEELVRAADSAMYTAKAAGKGRHVAAGSVPPVAGTPRRGGGGELAVVLELAVSAER